MQQEMSMVFSAHPTLCSSLPSLRRSLHRDPRRSQRCRRGLRMTMNYLVFLSYVVTGMVFYIVGYVRGRLDDR